MPKITQEQINQTLTSKLGKNANKLALPRISKVVINVGIGKIKTNPALFEKIAQSLASLSGQKPAPRVAKKAIAGFKIRQGEKVGLVTTLRGKRMRDFMIKLANIVLPRTRDFRGLEMKGFDKNANYTLGIPEHLVFPEISPEKAEELFGFSVSIVTTAKNPKEGQALLEAWGLPFSKE